MNRLSAYVASLVLIALVVTPAFRDPPRDSFPFSDFPMFSRGRPNALLQITHALGVDQSGLSEPLPPLISAGNEEVLQSMLIIHQAVAGGRAPAFCDQVAARVAADSDFDAVTSVQIATSEFDGIVYFEGNRNPRRRVVQASCDVSR